jgi:hypothetical protein
MARSHVCHLALVCLLVAIGGLSLDAHQDACHQRHSCPSDTGSYVCGDKGRCDQCPDNQYCLAGKPRMAASPSPVPAQPGVHPSEPTLPAGITVCFTPGGPCTGMIV